MGVGEVEDFLRREEKRQRRRQLRDEKRREQKEKARELWSHATSRLSSARRRRRASSGTSEELEDDSMPSSVIPVVPTLSSSSNASSTGSTSPTQRAGPITTTERVLAMFHSGLAYIRHSHMTAAQARVREQAGRFADAYGPEEPQDGVHGWGLGHYGVRERARLGRDVRNASRPRSDVEEVAEEREEKERARRGAGSGMWWWAPFRRWRLQDSTTYS